MCQVNRLVQSKCLFNLAAVAAADVWDETYKLVGCIILPSVANSALTVTDFCFFFFSSFHTLSSLFSGVDGFSVDVTTTMDIRDQNNKELAMRLVTNIQSGDVFYTDLNGFQVGLHTHSVISSSNKGGTDDGKIK